MKKTASMVWTLVIFGLVFVPQSFSQGGQATKGKGSGGWGMDTPYQRLYDPSKAETITGTVESVETIAPRKGMYPVVALVLKTDREVILVHLGPDWCIGRLDVKIEKGEKLEIKGSRATLSGKPVLVAAEIRRDGNTLLLRDNAGIPVWAGWRR